MLIKFGAIVTDGRGKLGGHVFAKNRGGNYIRTKVTPVNPQTTFQQTARAALAQFSQGWSRLTESQRLGWNSAVSAFSKTNIFGDSKNLSGKNLYTSLNRNLLVSGQPPIVDAPEPTGLTVPFSVSGEAGTTDPFQIEVFNTTMGETLVILATPPVSAGTSFVKNRYRVISSEFSFAPNTQIDITAAYTARFGALQTQNKIFVSVFSVNQIGQVSPKVSTFVIVDA